MFRAVVLLPVMIGCQARGPQGTTTTTETEPPTNTGTNYKPPTGTEPTGTEPKPGFSCLDGPLDPGPWDNHPIAVAGATVTRTPYNFDAGVQAVLTAADGAKSGTVVSLPVTGAVVTSLEYIPSANDGTHTFWVEDTNGSIVAFRVPTDPVDPLDLKPGNKVDFTATEVNEYFGTPEITSIFGFAVVGTEPVYLADGNDGTPLLWDTLGPRTVEVWGEIVSDAVSCGDTSVCMDLEYAGGTIVFRTAQSFFPIRGDCIHYIGPLSKFNGATQLDTGNLDWYRTF